MLCLPGTCGSSRTTWKPDQRGPVLPLVAIRHRSAWTAPRTGEATGLVKGVSRRRCTSPAFSPALGPWKITKKGLTAIGYAWFRIGIFTGVDRDIHSLWGRDDPRFPDLQIMRDERSLHLLGIGQDER